MEIKPNFSHTNCDIFAEKNLAMHFYCENRASNGPQIVNVKVSSEDKHKQYVN